MEKPTGATNRGKLVMKIERIVVNKDGFEVSGVEISKNEDETFQLLMKVLQQALSLLRESPTV